MPGLSLPFAVTGAAAGWLSATCLSNPFVDLFCLRRQELATLVAGVVGAICGALLTRRCKPGSRFDDEGAVVAPVLLTAIAGGMVASSLVCGIAIGGPASFVHGAFAGAPLGLLFLPICLVVIEAARRAARARLGSVVARADHREVFAVLSAALAVATLLVLPEWPAALVPGSLRRGIVERPWLAVAMLGAALGLHVLLLALDARGLRAIRRATAATKPLEPGTEVAPAAASVDLGLGDDLHGRTNRPRSAYRDLVRAELLVVGSPARAMAALRTAIRRKMLGLGLVVGALALHALAARMENAITMLERRCRAGISSSCERGAELSLELAVHEKTPLARAVHVGRAADLHTRACRSHSDIETRRRSCVAAATAHETGALGGGPDTSRAGPLRERACDAGHQESCFELATTLVLTDHRSRDLTRAAELFKRAGRTTRSVIAGRAAQGFGSQLGVGACLKGDASACRAEAASLEAREPSLSTHLARLANGPEEDDVTMAPGEPRPRAASR